MINFIQNSTALGTQNFLQQQGAVARLPEEIRTHGAEQVSTRNVEQAGTAPNTTGRPETDAARAEAEAKAKEKEDAEQQATIPPPPSRFQLHVQETTDKVNKTRQAVTQFFLSAATSGAKVNQQQSDGADRGAVDVVA